MSGTGIRAIAQNTHLPFFFISWKMLRLLSCLASLSVGNSMVHLKGSANFHVLLSFLVKLITFAFFSALSYKQKLFAHSKLFFFFLRVIKQKSVVESLLKKKKII